MHSVSFLIGTYSMTSISDHNGWKRKKNCNTMCSEQVKIDLNI